MIMPSGFDFSQDIYPLGDYEALPVSSKKNFEAMAYPEVVRLNILTNPDILIKEYEHFEKKENYNYFMSRARNLKIDLRKTFALFEELRFELGKKYHAYPIRMKGTNQIMDTVGPETRQWLKNLKVPTFRQQYVVAKEGWHTRLHTDHPDFRIHGYRMFVPLHTAYIAYSKNIYILTPGDCYFVNIARPHRGFCTGHERVVLMLQMASDDYIESGQPLMPAELSEIPKEYHESL